MINLLIISLDSDGHYPILFQINSHFCSDFKILKQLIDTLNDGQTNLDDDPSRPLRRPNSGPGSRTNEDVLPYHFLHQNKQSYLNDNEDDENIVEVEDELDLDKESSLDEDEAQFHDDDDDIEYPINNATLRPNLTIGNLSINHKSKQILKISDNESDDLKYTKHSAEIQALVNFK